MTVGSRAQVFHGTAEKTPGGLRRTELKKNKHGRIVSIKASNRAKSEKRLLKHGYTAVKGKFGAVRIADKKSRKKKTLKV